MKTLILLLLTTVLVYSCSGDDENNAVITDPVESITLKADGVEKSMTRNARGLSRSEPSLSLGFTTLFGAETLELFTRYKSTGKNKITEMKYLYDYQYYYSTADLQTDITVNNRLQFSATFSGTFLNEEGEPIEITEGRINTVYDEPIDSTWGW